MGLELGLFFHHSCILFLYSCKWFHFETTTNHLMSQSIRILLLLTMFIFVMLILRPKLMEEPSEDPWQVTKEWKLLILYIHYMDKSTGTPPSLEEKRALPNCGNKEIHVLKNNISTSVATVLTCIWNDCTHMYKSLVFGDAFLAQGLHLKSHQRCSAGIRTWLSADQSSSSTLTESAFLFDPCLIHRGTVMSE